MQSVLDRYEGNVSEEVKKSLKRDFWHLLQISGLFLDLTRPKRAAAIVQTILFFTLLGTSIPFTFTGAVKLINEPSLFIQTSHYFLLMVIATIVNLVYIANREVMINYVHTTNVLATMFGENGKQWLQSIQKKYRKKKLWSLFFPAGLIGCVIPILVVTPNIDEFFGAEKLSGVKDGVNFDIPIKMWFPFDTSDMSIFTLVYEFIVVALVGNIIIGSDFIFVIFSCKIIESIEILKLAIINIKDITNKKAKGDKYLYWDIYMENIKEIIDCHGEVVRLVSYFNQINFIQTSAAFMIGGLSMASSLTEAVFGAERIATATVNLLLGLCEFLYMTIFCWYGQKVYDLSSELHELIYATDWFICSEKIKKTKAIIMTMTSQSLSLTCWIWTLNLETLASVINFSYSYFNLLAASRIG